jgi:anti-anti-sigma factor
LLTLKRRIIGQTTLITLDVQTLDSRNTQDISRRVEDAMQGGTNVIVDLGALRYFDLSGFAEILNWAAGGRAGVDVRLCSQSGAIRALFQLLRADTVVRLYQNRGEALVSFRSSPRKGDSKVRRDGDDLLPGQRIA